MYMKDCTCLLASSSRKSWITRQKRKGPIWSPCLTPQAEEIKSAPLISKCNVVHNTATLMGRMRTSSQWHKYNRDRKGQEDVGVKSMCLLITQGLGSLYLTKHQLMSVCKNLCYDWNDYSVTHRQLQYHQVVTILPQKGVTVFHKTTNAQQLFVQLFIFILLRF